MHHSCRGSSALPICPSTPCCITPWPATLITQIECAHSPLSPATPPPHPCPTAPSAALLPHGTPMLHPLYGEKGATVFTRINLVLPPPHPASQCGLLLCPLLPCPRPGTPCCLPAPWHPHAPLSAWGKGATIFLNVEYVSFPPQRCPTCAGFPRAPLLTVSFCPAGPGPGGAVNGTREAKLSVIPKVSGLERSQERSYEADRDALLVPFLSKEPPAPAAPAPPPRPPSPLAPTRAPPPGPTAPRGAPLPRAQPPGLPQPHMKVSPFASQPQPGVYTAGLDLSTGG